MPLLKHCDEIHTLQITVQYDTTEKKNKSKITSYKKNKKKQTLKTEDTRK